MAINIEEIENEIQTYLDNRKNKISVLKITEVLSFTREFQYSVAETHCNEMEKEILEGLGMKSPSKKGYEGRVNAWEYATAWARMRSFYDADFGRFKHKLPGINVIPRDVSVRKESFTYPGRKRYSGNKLYSDYFIAQSNKDPFSFLIKTEESIEPHKISIFEMSATYGFGSELCRIDEHPLFKDLGFSLDKKYFVVKFKEYDYHIYAHNIVNSYSENEKLIKRIFTAFQKRELAKSHKNFIYESEVQVKYEDSLEAGNCRKGTEDFFNKNFPNGNKENFQISSFDLLKLEDSHYTRGAIFQAYLRTKREAAQKK